MDLDVFDEELEGLKGSISGVLNKNMADGVSPIQRGQGKGGRASGMSTADKAKLKGAFENIEYIMEKQRKIERSL